LYKEGKASIKQGKAFLNPKAKFLRDLSVALLNCTSKKNARILDATSGTGIRGIRYFLETKAKDVTMLDMNKDAYNSARKNAKENKIKAVILNKSLQEFANSKKQRFDVIDVDPFGGLSPYIYDIMKIASNGTILMLTATDTAVLCGAHGSACIRIYGSKPMHNEMCHETGIRILINYILGIASQFNYGIEVLFSVSYAHYMRVFIRLKYGSENSLLSIKNTGYAYYCNRCGFRSFEKKLLPKNTKCYYCKSDMQISGRMWLGNLCDNNTASKMLKYFRKHYDKNEINLLDTINNELDLPLYYSIPKTTRMMHTVSISPTEVISRLKKYGYDATRTHFDYNSVKTNADIKVIKNCINEKRDKL
jgi:tRNA (guanine26-N2/guanine27-N2)-dimethyltransferase